MCFCVSEFKGDYSNLGCIIQRVFRFAIMKVICFSGLLLLLCLSSFHKHVREVDVEQCDSWAPPHAVFRNTVFVEMEDIGIS